MTVRDIVNGHLFDINAQFVIGAMNNSGVQRDVYESWNQQPLSEDIQDRSISYMTIRFREGGSPYMYFEYDEDC